MGKRIPENKDMQMYEARLKKGLSQQEVADALGLSRVVVNRIENRKYEGTCSTETLVKIRKFLGI